MLLVSAAQGRAGSCRSDLGGWGGELCVGPGLEGLSTSRSWSPASSWCPDGCNTERCVRLPVSPLAPGAVG